MILYCLSFLGNEFSFAKNSLKYKYPYHISGISTKLGLVMMLTYALTIDSGITSKIHDYNAIIFFLQLFLISLKCDISKCDIS